MKERPILFNAEMVRAILSGRKTQTRRVMKLQPTPSKTREGDFWFSCNKMRSMVHISDFTPGNCVIPDAHELFSASCPIGAVGDRLWVRESWKPDAPCDGSWGDMEFYGCKCAPLNMIPPRFQNPEHCIYRASWEGPEMIGWHPSIHMPRWASRITLEVTGVRVERLNSISEDDAAAEGVQPAGELLPDYPSTYMTPKGDFSTAKVAFQRLWESIYKPESWQANPWVWVVEFKVTPNAQA